MKKPVKKAAAKKAAARSASTPKKPIKKAAGKTAKKAAKSLTVRAPSKKAVTTLNKKAIKGASKTGAKKVVPSTSKAPVRTSSPKKESSSKATAAQGSAKKKTSPSPRNAVKSPVKATSLKSSAAKKPTQGSPVKKKAVTLPGSKGKAARQLPVQPQEATPGSKVEQVASGPSSQSSTVGSPTRKDLGKVAHAIIRPHHAKDQKPAVTKSSTPVASTAPDLLENDEGANPGFFQTDEVFDETDYAQHLQLMEQADISRRARELNRPQVHPDFDGEHCIECDIQIPPARLQAGRIRCVDCQEEVESEARRNQNLIRGR